MMYMYIGLLFSHVQLSSFYGRFEPDITGRYSYEVFKDHSHHSLDRVWHVLVRLLNFVVVVVY